MKSVPDAVPTRRPLSLDAILDTATRIADRDGLAAVSIRRVAATLGGRPMSLYSFIESKDDLVARMLDQVMAGVVLKAVPDDWRTALLAIARRTIEVGIQHPWIVAASVQSTGPGPNTQAHATQTFEALAGLGADEERMRRLATAVDVYTIGFAMTAGADASADDLLFVDGITWLLDGFERELATSRSGQSDSFPPALPTEGAVARRADAPPVA